ncbi:uncharacterized protein LOC131033024 [Cryptomeria japonica]|uniref:uncharacterized protein LOC131033024 n=1 Tax=Cryptomeria japonica TaxID=3369 RepID=UPI0025AD5C32|nr:uncharacterized protein LOC131033024 [Cryptomeria japonica]
MSMLRQFRALPLAVLVFCAVMISADVYEILEYNNFPFGILPSNIDTYIFNKTNGNFEVNLYRECKIHQAGHKIRYRQHITGNITFGVIDNLQGVGVKFLFLYAPINTVTVRKNLLTAVMIGGTWSSSYDVNKFVEIKDCL